MGRAPQQDAASNQEKSSKKRLGESLMVEKKWYMWLVLESDLDNVVKALALSIQSQPQQLTMLLASSYMHHVHLLCGELAVGVPSFGG